MNSDHPRASIEQLAARFSVAPAKLQAWLRKRTANAQHGLTEEDLLAIMRCEAATIQDLGLKAFLVTVKGLEIAICNRFQRLQNRGETADALQNARIALLLQVNRPGFHLRKKRLPKYYAGILHNQLYDIDKRNQKHALVSIDEDSDPERAGAHANLLAQLPDQLQTVLDRMDEEDRLQAIQEVLQGLTDRRREALILRYFERWNFESIQHHFQHATEQSTRNLVSDAIKDLRSLIRQHPYFRHHSP